MPRSRLAAALAMAMVALCPGLSSAETAPAAAGAGWREAGSITALVSSLEDWLDPRLDWSRRAAAPQVRLVSQLQAAARRGESGSLQRGRLRGLYDPDRTEILLVRPWNPRDAEDVGVLLHELVHHRQAPHHWYCPAAQELAAYRLQETWLSEQGLASDVNWMAVVLDAGCPRRDVHPD